MKAIIAKLLFEASPWSPFWSAWSVGYIVVGGDGLIYLTEAGSDYLDSLGGVGCELCTAST